MFVLVGQSNWSSRVEGTNLPCADLFPRQKFFHDGRRLLSKRADGGAGWTLIDKENGGRAKSRHIQETHTQRLMTRGKEVRPRRE